MGLTKIEIYEKIDLNHKIDKIWNKKKSLCRINSTP